MGFEGAAMGKKEEKVLLSKKESAQRVPQQGEPSPLT